MSEQYVIKYTGTNRETYLDSRGYVTDKIEDAIQFDSRVEATLHCYAEREEVKKYYKIKKL